MGDPTKLKIAWNQVRGDYNKAVFRQFYLPPCAEQGLIRLGGQRLHLLDSSADQIERGPFFI